MRSKQVMGLVCVVALLGSFVFTSCSQKEAAQEETKKEETKKSVSVMFQGGEPEQAAVMASLNRFSEKTGIEVDALYTPHGGYNEKLSGYISSGKMPDIIQLDAPFLSNYVWSGVIAPIGDFIDAATIEDMTASNVSQCTYPIDNELYAISHQDSTVLLYANKAYLEKISARIPTSLEDAWTGAEFNEILAKLAALPEVQWPLDVMNAYGMRTEWATFGLGPYMESAGSGIIDRKTWVADGVINSAENIAAAKQIQKWAQNDWVVPSSAGDNQFFNSDKSAALAWCGHWLWPAASNALGEDLVALPLPNFGNGTVSPNGSWVWAIPEKAGNKEGAADLLEFMMSDGAFFEDLEAMNVFPGMKKFLAISEAYKDEKQMAIAMEQASLTAVSRPQHPAYPVITKSFAEAFDDIINGDVDPEKALNKAAEAIDEDILDNDGYPPFGG